MSLPIVRLAGSPYEQGSQHGTALRPAIEHNLRVYFDRFYREGGVARADVLQRASRYARAIATANENYFDGMRGIAAGSGFSLEEVTALNVRYEILYYQYAQKQMTAAGDGSLAVGDGSTATRDGCTAFALAPQRTSNGHLVLGQNWDWIPDVKGALLYSAHTDGLQTVAFTEAGIFGGKIGLNSAGLGLAINGITTTSDDWQRLNKPFHVRCYEILLQQSLEDAAAVINDEARACSANFLIACAPDEALNLEAAPDAVNVMPWEQGCLVHTNHFVDPDGLEIEEPPDDLRRFSCLRRKRFQGFLEASPAISIEQLQGHLRDHQNAPRSICRHENPEAPIDEQYRTVTSIVMDLHDRRLWATNGPPCENAYLTTKLDE